MQLKKQPKSTGPLKPLGIYVHVPFCRSKCEYCDFYSLGGGLNKESMELYLQAVLAHIRETAQRVSGYEVDTEQLLKELKENALEQGITLSGGEPFCQCAAMLEPAKGAHAVGRDVWIYSGYTLEQIQADSEKAALLSECDVLVDGPYVEAERTLALPFRGSTNQRIIDVQRSLREGRVILKEY